MKFYKTDWERKEPPVKVSESTLNDIVDIAFPNKKLASYELIASGRGNTNIRFSLEDSSDNFLLRFYTRDKDALTREETLTQQFGKEIQMPEFLYVNKDKYHYPFAIQRWVEGIHLYDLFNQNASSQELESIAKEVAATLTRIASHSFEKAGFFSKNLDIMPFESTNDTHPFISYIEDCLLKEHSGKWLGPALTEKILKFVAENKSFFPSLEPACLVQGDFNPDNIIIQEKTLKVAVVVDWEFAFAGSYLFEIYYDLKSQPISKRHLLKVMQQNAKSLYRKNGGK